MKTGTLISWQDGKFLVGRLRERPDVFSQGETLEVLGSNIREALELMEATDLQGVPPHA